MQFLTLEPLVPGQLGDDTELDTSVHPPIIVNSNLHIHIDTTFDSSLITIFPVYCVTRELKADIERAGLTGCAFDRAKITKSDMFHDFYPEGKELPDLEWIKIEGVAGKDDFGMSADHFLVVSQKAYSVLQEHPLAECKVKQFKG